MTNSFMVCVNSKSAGIDLRRQNLTSADVIFILTSKVDPRPVKVKIFLMAVDT